MDIKLYDKFIKSKCVRPRKQVDGYALFHTENARFFITNEVGYYIWNSCDGNQTVEQIISSVYNNFEEKPELQQIETDVINLLTEFQNFELVSR